LHNQVYDPPEESRRVKPMPVILDIPRKKLFTPTIKIEMLELTVAAEIAYISAFL
jgi:hypothetical protein